jgi:cobalt-zinc-cadmium resistance protein CzcA
MQQKKLLLTEADSIFDNLLTKARQRYNLGDIDIIEITTTESQRLQIAIQLEALESDYAILLHQFRALINVRDFVEPYNIEGIQYGLPEQMSDYTLVNNAQLRIYQQSIKLSESEIKLQTAKLLPSLTAGVNNTSIIGWQKFESNPEQYYGAGKRFTSVNVGMGVPLFYGAQRSKIRAADKLKIQRELELSSARLLLNTELENAKNIYNKNRRSVEIWKKSLLPNAATIITAANNRLSLGEISYLDWVILINQALQVRSDYFNTVIQMNEAAFEIERLSTF